MKSMTGFGKAQERTDQYQIDIEIKSVNQRFLDIQFRMPKVLNELENDLRRILKEYLTRGRVDVFITLTQRKPGPKQVQMDWSLLEQVVREITIGSKEKFGVTIDPTVLIEKLSLEDSFLLLQENTQEDDFLYPTVISVFKEALRGIVCSREKEGNLLKEVLNEQKQGIEEKVVHLRSFTSLYEQEYQEKLTKKLLERVDTELDQSRVLTELAILLERGDIHEELDRLTVHLENLEDLLNETAPVGRELDFLIQELTREVNTIGSKSSAIEMKNQVVQLKTIIEKMREQVQNIE